MGNVFQLHLLARLLMRPDCKWHPFEGSWLHRGFSYNGKLPHRSLVSAILPACPTIDSLHMKLLLISHTTTVQQLQLLLIIQTHYGTTSKTEAAQSQ